MCHDIVLGFRNTASSDILQVYFENTLPLKGILSVFSQAYMYMPPKYL